MTDQTNTEAIASDDKLMALVVNIGSIFSGIILPLVIYLIYKKKNKFVSFYSLQSLYFHIFLIIMFIILWNAVGIILFSLNVNIDNADEMFTRQWFTKELIIQGSIFLLYIVSAIFLIRVGFKANKGLIVKLPLAGKMAYEKVYEEEYKKSFNLSRNYKSEFTYKDKTSEQKRGKGLI